MEEKLRETKALVAGWETEVAQLREQRGALLAASSSTPEASQVLSVKKVQSLLDILKAGLEHSRARHKAHKVERYDSFFT